MKRQALGRQRWTIPEYQLLVLICGLASWEVASGRLIQTVWISKPTMVAERILDWFLNGFVYPHLLATGREMLLGLVIGAGLGIVLGLLIGLRPWLAEMLDPFISAAYSLPRVAFLPLLLLWFGLGLAPKVALIALMVFFVLFLNTLAGVREVDQDLVNSVRVMGASQPQVMRIIVFPSILSFVTAGLVIAVPYSLMGALVGEMLVGSEGLGFLLVSSSGRLDMTGLFAASIVVTVWGLVASVVVGRQGERLASWRTETQ